MRGISRKFFWNDLQKARHKVVDALVNGKGIEISRGEYINSGECKVEFLCSGCHYKWELQCNTERPTSCPMCGSRIIYRIGGDGRGERFIENNYCCPKNKGKAVEVNEKEGSVEDDKNCYTIDE